MDIPLTPTGILLEDEDMKLDVSPEIRTNPLLCALVDSAGTLLEGIIGPPADEMTAGWSVQTERDRPAGIALTLQDTNRWVRATFSINEFQNPDHIRARFVRLWEDLLDMGPKSRIVKALPPQFYSVPQGTWCG